MAFRVESCAWRGPVRRCLGFLRLGNRSQVHKVSRKSKNRPSDRWTSAKAWNGQVMKSQKATTVKQQGDKGLVGGGGLKRRFKLTSGVIKVKSCMLWSGNVRFKHPESQTPHSSHSLTKRVYLSPPSAFLIFAENGEGVCFFNQRTHRFA
jgi:hypothetical protein